MSTFAEVAEDINRHEAENKAKELEPLKKFMKAERVAEMVADAEKFRKSFPQFWNEEIRPAVEAVERIYFGGGVPPVVQSLILELTKPMHGSGVGGVHVLSVMDQLKDGVDYVKNLKPSDVSTLTGYRLAQFTIAQRLQVGDIRNRLLMTRDHLLQYLKAYAEALNSGVQPAVKIAGRIE